MERIKSIRLNLQTASVGGAGSDGDVYLGLCGREFYLDTDRDDFEPGTSINYVLGDGANIHNASQNDPREHLLFLENAYKLPCYIRFKGKDRGDQWRLLRAGVAINDHVLPTWDTASVIPFGAGGGIWMGTRATEFVMVPLEDPAGIRGEGMATAAAKSG